MKITGLFHPHVTWQKMEMDFSILR